LSKELKKRSLTSEEQRIAGKPCARSKKKQRKKLRKALVGSGNTKKGTGEICRPVSGETFPEKKKTAKKNRRSKDPERDG